MDKEVIEVELAGNEALDQTKGKNGSLKVRICVKEDVNNWRVDHDIFSKHCITLGEALTGCTLTIPTIGGTQSIKLGQFSEAEEIIPSRHILPGKGVEGTKGDHIAVVKVWTPKRLDAETVKFAKRLADITIRSQSRLTYDETACSYVPPVAVNRTKKQQPKAS